MRIKIGNRWYECKADQSIMIELTEADKMNIAKMAPDATKYACFDDADERTIDEKLAWMKS
jgi:hypothetical protein